MPTSAEQLPDAAVPMPADEIAFGRAILRDEAAALVALADALGEPFTRAVGLIVQCASAGGSVLLTGLGKSGLVGAKISATFSSLGIPSHSVHPSEAFHGDLGRFRATDTVICISYSGETDEVVNLAAVLRQDGLPIISITGGAQPGQSSLERLATVALRLGIEREAGGGTFHAPTSSTTATMAIGDALGLVAARRMNFTSADFKRRHPGGSLGELLRPITDVMRTFTGRNLPLVSDTLSVSEALAHAGLFTDGDLRRLILRNPAELSRPISEVMTRTPRTLVDTALVDDAVKMFREYRQDEIPVVDSAGRPVGILDVQDLMAMKLVKD
ncbi:MAG: SIS domain-containing protein [Planctomycetota bacterium]|nr:SIS domain-containing protein [Planctomycetota bacterium]